MQSAEKSRNRLDGKLRSYGLIPTRGDRCCYVAYTDAHKSSKSSHAANAQPPGRRNDVATATFAGRTESEDRRRKDHALISNADKAVDPDRLDFNMEKALEFFIR